MNIALNMIIGQRKEEYLEYALKSTAWLDEHVIINTGNSDNPNLKIIDKVLPKAKIIPFKGEFSFCNARNQALNNTDSPWVLWEDADEVHFDAFQEFARQCANDNTDDAIGCGFYHFLLDVFHYQSIDERIILFKKDDKRWIGDVHEQVEGHRNVAYSGYRYHHYGYTKPQSEIYENWKLYWSLNPAEQYKLKEQRNPDDIITDRVTVANPYTANYPEVIIDYIEKQKPKVKDYKFV